jgi:hypothetical protein
MNPNGSTDGYRVNWGTIIALLRVRPCIGKGVDIIDGAPVVKGKGTRAVNGNIAHFPRDLRMCKRGWRLCVHRGDMVREPRASR